MVGKVMEHIAFHLFTILLILFDIAIVVTDLAAGSSAHYHDELEICSRVIITYFMLEVMLRIFYKGWAKDKFNREILSYVICQSEHAFNVADFWYEFWGIFQN